MWPLKGSYIALYNPLKGPVCSDDGTEDRALACIGVVGQLFLCEMLSARVPGQVTSGHCKLTGIACEMLSACAPKQATSGLVGLMPPCKGPDTKQIIVVTMCFLEHFRANKLVSIA